MEEVYSIVEQAIDYAFIKDKFTFNFYEFLKSNKATKKQVEDFIESATSANLNNIVMDLDEYLIGGSDDEHKQLREAYGHYPKPHARKIRNYLYKILEDAWKYEKEKKSRRKKKVASK
jgi:hypothetical protein